MTNPKEIMKNKISEEARNDRTLRNEYEQYFYSVFKGKMCFSKILENNEPTPDFRVILNGKEFITEVKGLDPIYDFTCDTFTKICNELKKEELIKNFVLEVTPFNLHIEDKETIEESLKKIIPSLDDSRDSICFEIKTKRTTYLFKLEKRDFPNGTSFSSGTYYKETSNLRNAMRSNKQYEKIDFLTLINLNRENEGDRLIEEILTPDSWAFIGKENKISVISVFKNNIFNRHKNIKFVLVLDPISNTAYIILSPYQVSDFEPTEMYHLILVLKSVGFRVKLNTIKLEWVEYD